jgi:hypothetical protein
MKKITSLILSAALLITLCACEAQADSGNSGNPTDAAEQSPSQTDFTKTEMPSPFEYDGGDENRDFNQRYDSRILGGMIIPDVFAEYLRLSEEDFLHAREEKWDLDFQNSLDKSGLTETCNVYSLMVEFDIPDEVVADAVKKNNEHYERVIELQNGDDYHKQDIFSSADLEALLSRDEKIITAKFATKQAIVIGDRAYSPIWLYSHSSDDYKAAGITQGMIEDKLELYGEFNFTAEAAEAFGKKLSAFTGTDISLDNVS